MATLTITKETDEQYELSFVLRDIQDAAKGIENLTVGYVGEEHYPTQVTLIGPPQAVEQVFRYFYRDADAVLSAAENIEHKKYRQIIKDAAENVRQEIAEGDIEDEDALTEAIERAGEVIYTSEAALTLRHSRNDDAYENEIGEEGADDCDKASFAQAADIREELGDLEELLDRLLPATDDQKANALERCCGHLDEEPYAVREAILDAFLDICEDETGDMTKQKEDCFGYVQDVLADEIAARDDTPNTNTSTS